MCIVANRTPGAKRVKDFKHMACMWLHIPVGLSAVSYWASGCKFQCNLKCLFLKCPLEIEVFS